jgi:antitoxin (DNA-binding transcriptional repressor) of toxin-antitoxin stability system
VIQVTVAEAQKRLPELLVLVETGESVEIHPESGDSFLLVHKPKHDSGAAEWQGYPKAGSLKGKIWMSDDFDEPLEEFREYME